MNAIDERKLTIIDVKELFQILGNANLLSLFELSDRDKKILELRWKLGYSNKQIGYEYSISPERANQIYSRAKRRLIQNINVGRNKYFNLLNIEKENEELKYENEKLINDVEILNKRFDALNERDKKFVGTADVLNIKVVDLDISVRLLKIFQHYDIKIINDLIQCSREELLMIWNFGEKSMKELEDLLNTLNVGLKLNKKINLREDKNIFN